MTQISDENSVYEKRIETLRGCATEEGITVNETSVEDFRLFVGHIWPSNRAQLILTDDGNLRAIWKEHPSRLGLEFTGDRQVIYVVFKRSYPIEEVSRLSGEASFTQIVELIKEWDFPHKRVYR